MKQVSGDAEGAQALNAQADALETQADALEQAQAMEQAQREAQGDAIQLEEKAEPVIDEAGEVNEDAFSKVVDQIEEDVCKAGGAPAQDDGVQALLDARAAARKEKNWAVADGVRHHPA